VAPVCASEADAAPAVMPAKANPVMVTAVTVPRRRDSFRLSERHHT
jgi:hypothetical protein